MDSGLLVIVGAGMTGLSALAAQYIAGRFAESREERQRKEQSKKEQIEAAKKLYIDTLLILHKIRDPYTDTADVNKQDYLNIQFRLELFAAREIFDQFKTAATALNKWLGVYKELQKNPSTWSAREKEITGLVSEADRELKKLRDLMRDHVVVLEARN